jgi:hypothetical protein
VKVCRRVFQRDGFGVVEKDAGKEDGVETIIMIMKEIVVVLKD